VTSGFHGLTPTCFIVCFPARTIVSPRSRTTMSLRSKVTHRVFPDFNSGALAGRHLSGNAALQELVEKSFQIKKSCWTSFWH
jgi:hypothetical protein